MSAIVLAKSLLHIGAWDEQAIINADRKEMHKEEKAVWNVE